MCFKIKISSIIIFWTIICHSMQCSLFSNLLNNPPSYPQQSQPQFTGQPITLKVPKEKAEQLRKELEQNPNLINNLIANENNRNVANPRIPTGTRNQFINGVSSVPSYFNRAPTYNPYPFTTGALPKETMINGQRFVLTSRAEILMRNKANFIRNVFSPPVNNYYPAVTNYIVPTNVPTIISSNSTNQENNTTEDSEETVEIIEEVEDSDEDEE